MRDFTFYIHDQRYTVPTLAVVEADDEELAWELAKKRLSESPFHVAIEVREGDRPLARFDRTILD